MVVAGSRGEIGYKYREPAEKIYREIQTWEYDGEGITTAPHEIDIAADITNDTALIFEGKLKFVVAMRFENDDVKDHKIGSWEREREVYNRTISFSANEKQTFRLEKFDLAEFLNAKQNQNYLKALLFRVIVLDSRGTEIDKKEKVLSVTLGD